MWCSVAVVCVVLGVVVCPHHPPPGRLVNSIGSTKWQEEMKTLKGGLGPKGNPTETVKSLAHTVMKEFKELITVKDDYDPVAYRKEVDGTLYFVKVKLRGGPDGEVVAILRIDDKGEDQDSRLEGYVLVTVDDTIDFIMNGTNLPGAVLLAKPSTEMPVTKKVKQLVAKFRPVFRARVVKRLLYLVDSKATLDVVAFKHQGVSFENYWVKARSKHSDSTARYIVLHLSKSRGGKLQASAARVMNAYEEIPKLDDGTNMNTFNRTFTSVSVSIQPVVSVVVTSYVGIYLL